MLLNVLDEGYVRLVDVMGDDLSVVNAARVSYQKESTKFQDRDQSLLKFLLREGHTSPLRHAFLSLEVHAPLMVARQWWKYIVGSDHRDVMVAWNESSRRYVTETPTFYVPREDQWRSKPENSKQGSGGTLSPGYGFQFTKELELFIAQGEQLYERALKQGIAPEQARLFLPAYSLYVRWRWSASLAGVLFFLSQRLEHDAQWEIQQYARCVAAIAEAKFPKTLDAWQKTRTP